MLFRFPRRCPKNFTNLLLKSWAVAIAQLFLAPVLLTTLVAPSHSLLAEEGTFAWSTDPATSSTTLDFAGQPVIRYEHAFDRSTPERFDETFKPFVHAFSPKSAVQLTKGSGGLYTHHRGIYLGWNQVIASDQKSYDFWHCTQGAHQQHVEFKSLTTSATQASMVSLVHWNSNEGDAIVAETRTVTVQSSTIDHPQLPTGWQLDWTSVLESKRDELKLTGDRQHAGLHFRANQDVATLLGARYLRPESFPQQPDAVQVDDAKTPDGHINLPWLAMQFTTSEQPCTVVYFPEPGLPQPARFSERPYGRFGSFFDLTLKRNAPFTMQYRLLILPTLEVKPADIEAAYRAFTTTHAAN
jgi:Methane oxygenase PmoA